MAGDEHAALYLGQAGIANSSIGLTAEDLVNAERRRDAEHEDLMARVEAIQPTHAGRRRAQVGARPPNPPLPKGSALLDVYAGIYGAVPADGAVPPETAQYGGPMGGHYGKSQYQEQTGSGYGYMPPHDGPSYGYAARSRLTYDLGEFYL